MGPPNVFLVAPSLVQGPAASDSKAWDQTKRSHTESFLGNVVEMKVGTDDENSDLKVFQDVHEQ